MTTSSASLFNGKHAVVSIAVVLVLMLPAVLLGPLGWGDATGPFVMAALTGLMAAMFGGIALALRVTVGLALMAMLSLPAAPYPVWAGLVMAISALLYGLTARSGLTMMVVSAPIAVAFLIADPPQLKQASMTADVLVLGLFVLLGGLWGTASGGAAARRTPRQAPPLSPWSTAVTFGVTMAIVTGVTMGIVVATGIGHTGAWILLTMLLVIQPAVHQTFRRSLERALGTVIGFGIALVIALLVDDKTALLVLGIVFLTLAVYVKMDPRAQYWHFTMLLTPGIVLAEGAGADVIATDIDRLWASLTGIAVALVLLGVFYLFGVRGKDPTGKDVSTEAPAGT